MVNNIRCFKAFRRGNGGDLVSCYINSVQGMVHYKLGKLNRANKAAGPLCQFLCCFDLFENKDKALLWKENFVVYEVIAHNVRCWDGYPYTKRNVLNCEVTNKLGGLKCSSVRLIRRVI
jgi:hypothetical protein